MQELIRQYADACAQRRDFVLAYEDKKFDELIIEGKARVMGLNSVPPFV